MINGKQPLITLSVKINLVDAKRLGILDNMNEDEFRDRAYNLLTFIHPNIKVVDLGTASAYITSFACTSRNSAEIEAVLTAYEKEISAELVEEAHAKLRDKLVKGYFSKKGIGDVRLGMYFQVASIDFVNSIVTFKLAE